MNEPKLANSMEWLNYSKSGAISPSDPPTIYTYSLQNSDSVLVIPKIMSVDTVSTLDTTKILEVVE